MRAAQCEVSAETRDLLRRHSCVNRDNLQLDDLETAVFEAKAYRAVGGRTIVDLTGEGLGPRPEAVLQVAERAEINVVHGCGPYCEYALSPTEVLRDVDEIAAGILTSLEDGIAGTSVRAGVIGEIGVNGQVLGESTRSCLMTPTEERGLRAAARVSLSSGAPIVVHQPNVPEATTEIVRVLESEQVPPDRVCLGHMSSVMSLDLHEAILRRGYWIAYDNFGMELDNRFLSDTRDSRRVEWLASLLMKGLGDRILVSHDVWSKIQLQRYGGNGFTHIHRFVVPWLRQAGGADEMIDALLVDNPQRFYAWR